MRRQIIRKNSENNTSIDIYIPTIKSSDLAIIIFPGGGYFEKCSYEGKDYAEFLNANGHTAFVVNYSTKNTCSKSFPEQLFDARAAICYVRRNAKRFDVDEDKINVMGSSAGGHLAALVSTCREEFESERQEEYFGENYVPNGQILCYPVIDTLGEFVHYGSIKNLLSENYNEETCKKCSPSLIAQKGTPKAFIWHTFEDGSVPVNNSLCYASKLKEIETSCELHIFPYGRHGLALANRGAPNEEHVETWKDLLLRWLKNI